MGMFEDNIRKKFDEAEVPLGSGSWDAFEHKLDGAQMSDLIFTQKVVNALEFSLVPYSPEHWKAMHEQLDLDKEGNFDSKIRSKFSEGAELVGPAVGWEDMLSKLDVVGADGFESTVKEKLDEAEVEYQKEHWKAMERMLDKDRRPAFWAIFTVGLVLTGALAFWGVPSDDSVGLTNEKKTVKNKVEFDIKSNDEVNKAGIQEELIAKESVDGKVDESKLITVQSDHEQTEGRDGKLSEREFVTRKRRLAREERIKAQYVAFSKRLNKKDGGTIGGGARGQLGGGIAGGVNDRSHGVSNGVNVANFNSGSNSSEDDQINMPEMIEEGVALSEPYLDYQYTEVQLKKVSTKPSMLHVGLLPWLNFWDNAAATGLSGKHQFSLFSSEDWKIYRRYGKQVGFEFNQPFQMLAGYEYRSDRTGNAVGTYVSNTWHNNWICTSANISGSTEKNLGNSVLRIGVGMAYKRNQLVTEGLTLRDQVSQTASNFNETALDELKVPAEIYISSSAGLMLINKHFMFAYNIGNPILLRVNYNNEKKITHTGIASGTLSLNNGVKLSGLVKISVQEDTEFTPALSFSKNDKFFLLSEYENLNRFVNTLGYQFPKLRAYVSYGHVSGRVLESAITDLFSQKGHVVVGLTYTR